MARIAPVVLAALALAVPGAASAQSGAPAGGPATRYCMKVTLTGYVIEPVRCWTRDQWVAQGVDLDRAWAREGVRVIG